MDEYISREEAIEAIRYRVCQGHGNKEHICKRGSCAYCGIMEIMNDISSIEAADVQPVKHGRWENGHCTHCGEDVASKLDTWTDVQNFIYCPNCGSKNEDGDSE